LESVWGDPNQAVGAAWEFDAGDRRESATLGNGLKSLFEYDLDNRLTRIQHGKMVGEALDPFYDVQQGYDAVGNKLWKRDNVLTERSETYSYDDP
jgi:hypothetical protein